MIMVAVLEAVPNFFLNSKYHVPKTFPMPLEISQRVFSEKMRGFTMYGHDGQFTCLVLRRHHLKVLPCMVMTAKLDAWF